VNILVTGGFGSIGVVVVEECLRRGHTVCVFEVRNGRTEKLAGRYGKRNVKVLFGDLRKPDDVTRAVVDQDAVLHLAAILPPVSDAQPDLCRAVNTGGTGNLIRALQTVSRGTALVSVSSASVMGPTQKRNPPVRPDDPLSPMDPYSRSKIEAEALVTASGLNYCILRLAAVLPTVPNYSSLFSMTRLLFEMPLDARCEIVLDLDVAYALVSAAESLLGSGEISGKRGFIAGGRTQGCQMTTRDLVGVLFGPLGFRFPDESLFSPELDSYYLDWYDTEETQAILGYQRHSVGEWQAMILKMVRHVLPVLPLFKAGITRWIERQSPRYPASTHQGGHAA
jgi:nucleoside-diphosphate-sugar epimerase